MTLCFLSFNGRPLCDTCTVSRPIDIYMKHSLPRTCLLWVKKMENHYDLSPDSASSPTSSSRRWHCISCFLFPVFSVAQASLHTPPSSTGRLPSSPPCNFKPWSLSGQAGKWWFPGERRGRWGGRGRLGCVYAGKHRANPLNPIDLCLLVAGSLSAGERGGTHSH